jgi:hypothetical protein
MELESVLRTLHIIATLGIGSATLFIARLTRAKADARELAERFAAHELRLAALEHEVDNLPSSAQLAELAGDMKAVKAELAGVARSLDPLTRSVERMNEYLLHAPR